MDLEVLGRHALLFDDDSMAIFVNSSDALVEWHSLKIDRYDVRHLLFSPPPPRRRNRILEPLNVDELALEAHLDHERYIDLPLVCDEPDLDKEVCHQTTDYQAVGFSYENTNDSANQKDADVGTNFSEFQPPFPVPGDLPCLPQSDKVHQIIAKTALFVSTHGGQSEIILRVKQGDNPSFGFLMPDNELHAYFRYLVENPQLLHSVSKESSRDLQQKNRSASPVAGGALSLLGSVYDSGEEDEPDATEKIDASQGITEPVNCGSSSSSKKIETKSDVEKTESMPKSPVLPSKEKVICVKKNSSVATLKSRRVKGLDGKPNSGSATADIPNSTSVMNSKIQAVVLDPPPEVKRLIDKLVEYIVRNGKQFETMLIEQDRGYGRFQFLLPSDQYHSYYLKALQDGQELKVRGKSKAQKDDHGSDRSVKDSIFSDIPMDERKDQFKMVINKLKKDAAEIESEGSQRESEFTVDAAAAAAILEAATRGIKSSVISRSSPSDHIISQNFEAENESNGSEVHLTEEQKLKAERLKKAKNFVAMLKSGENPFKAGGQSRSSSLDPVAQGISRSADEGDFESRVRDENAIPVNPEERNSRRLKRNFRSRLEENEDSAGERENDAESAKKHHRRRHLSHSSNDEVDRGEKSRDHRSSRVKHRSRDDESKDKHEDAKDHKSSRKKSRSHQHSYHEHSRKRHSSKDYIEEGDENDDHYREKKKSKDRHRHRSSNHSGKAKKRYSDDDELEKKSSSHHGRDDAKEGDEISSVRSESKRILNASVRRETSVDAIVGVFPQRAPSQAPDTEVPDDLRAKIRAMLLATRLS